MTGDDLRAARATLGEMWGLGRPLHLAELGRACRLSGRDPGQTIDRYERGEREISGPVSALVALYLAGASPPDGLAHVVQRRAMGSS